MFGNKAKSNIAVIIGEYGILFTLHKSGKIEQKLYIKNFSDKVKSQLKKILLKNKSVPISIILDTAEQSYKKKDYPRIKKNDLVHLIKRDLANDSDKKSIKNYLILKTEKSIRSEKAKDSKNHVLFISSSISKITEEFIEFIGNLPNSLVGIFMLPLESTNLFKKIKEDVKSSSRLENKNCDIYCLVTQNKTSGVRQVIFYQDQLIFTRLLDYGCVDQNFAEKYEKDLIATADYLNRLFPEIDISELETVNILPKYALDKINKIKNLDFHFINYTPKKASLILSKNLNLSDESVFCDLIFAKNFCESKKNILKFTTNEIKKIHNLQLVTKASYFANLLILVLIGVFSLNAISKINNIQENISIQKANKLQALQTLNKEKNKILDGDKLIDPKTNNEIEIEKILDLGKLHENFSEIEKMPFLHFGKLEFVRNFPVKINDFDYKLQNFTSDKITKNHQFSIVVKGKILNKEGNIESLFSSFDSLSSEFKKQYKNHEVSYSELPRDIDFAKKYYDFDINFTVKNKR